MQNHLKEFCPDLPFDQEDANRYLPWVIAVMATLTALMFALGITMNHLFLSQHGELEHRVQIQVPYADGSEKQTAQAIIQKLNQMNGIDKVHLLPEYELADLLEPWLGSREVLDLMPIPIVIEVWVDEEAYAEQTITRASLSQELKKVYPTLEIDDYQNWIEDFNHVTQTIQHVSFVIAILILLASLTVMLLITRTSVQLHFPIVTLLHRMGAEDQYIIRQFQINAAQITVKGALIGTMIAVFIFYLLETAMVSLNATMLPHTLFSDWHYVMFIALPIIMTVAVLSITSLSLRRMLLNLY